MQAESRKDRGSVSVRWLLLGVNGLVVLMPLLAVLGMKIYQNHLIAQTETGLIGQAVVIGEAWRSVYREQLDGRDHGAVEPSIMPPDSADATFAPVEPVVDLGEGVLPPLAGPSRFVEERDTPAVRSGKVLEPLLARAKIFNLSSARILDVEGCTVASSGAWAYGCFEDYDEINNALRGRYSAVARERHSDDPAPPFASISRRGDVRVFVALPVFEGGKVIGVVWMSRTSMAPLKAAWMNRRSLTAALLISVLVTVLVSLFLSRTITRPLRSITDTASAVAAGKSLPSMRKGFTPAEVRELEAALHTMAEQLSDRARYIADYAANASHELKSPITAIRGAAELLRDEGQEMSEEQRNKFLANIEADASRMERLVSRLLQLAKIQSAPETAEDINVRSFLEQIAEGYDHVSLQLADGLGTVAMNRDHLESAVRNLLDNAVRYGGGSQVDLEAWLREGRLVIRVRDRGPGISDANRARIFERFFTTERDRGGTGLGLAIVQAVARTRGGEVDVDTGSEGTVFTLRV